jgi:type IV secretory pathway ATPase VirB11/archaellum biosynthesis ATPase
MERLRNESLRRAITVLHVRTSEEGEWICSTAAARIARERVQVLAPHDGKVIDLVEQAIRSKVAIVFVGEIRRDEDARAMRAAATLGIRTVAFIVRDRRVDAENLLTILGAWSSFDLALLSEYAY